MRYLFFISVKRLAALVTPFNAVIRNRRAAALFNSGPYYGWIRLVLANDGSTGLIRDWAYDDSGSAITIGAIPEPSVPGLSILGATAFCFRRKRRFDVK